jgi:hypothetical protein
MRTLEHTIDIDAPAFTTWAVVSDFAAYPEWNPFLVAAAGELQPGATLAVTFKAGTRKPVKMTPKVVEAEPGRVLRWKGSLPIPRLFEGQHELRVEPVDGTHSRFVQRETFRGILVPFLGRLLRDTSSSFEAMNQALKSRAEEASRGPRPGSQGAPVLQD